jgi:hypothetical protein
MSDSRLGDILAISDIVHRLTIGFTTVADGHRVHHPGLLRQARLTMIHGKAEEDESLKTHQKRVHSPTPMPEHIFMTIMEAEAEVAIIAVSYGMADRRNPEDTLRAIVGGLSDLDNDQLADIVRDLAYVRRRLEVALAWEPADRKIRAKCPACEVNDALWVKLDQHGPALAYCASCHERWLPQELADIINPEETAR